MGALGIAKSGLKGLLLGGVLYMAGDQASDMITYSKMHSQAMELVANDQQVPQMIGESYSSGAWYDATLAFSHRDKVAHCTFQLKGSKGITDIAVKAGRQAGYKSNILYNTIGPATWQLISCQVMVPSEGGLVAPRSLMPDHQEQGQQQSAAVQQSQQARQQHVHKQLFDKQQMEQQQQQQQQQEQQQAPEQRRWGHKLWWRRRQQQLQQQQQQQQQQQLQLQEAEQQTS